jgi:hypothetical protein
VVEHLIQTSVPVTMLQYLKEEMVGLKASAKASTTLLKILESKMSR